MLKVINGYNSSVREKASDDQWQKVEHSDLDLFENILGRDLYLVCVYM